MSGFDIEVVCPACGSAFRVPHLRVGREASCPVCGTGVLVSEPKGEAPRKGEEPPQGSPAAEVVDPPASTSYIVCASDEERLNVLALRPVVVEHAGLSHAEAGLQITRGMGVIAEGVSARDAEAMVAKLRGIGVSAFAVPADRVPEVEKELPKVRIYGASAGGLDVQTDAAGTIRSVPWGAIVAGFCTKLRAAPQRPRPASGGSLLGGPLASPVFMPGLAGGLGFAVHRALSQPPYRPRGPARQHDLELTLLLRGRSGAISSLKVGEHQVRYRYLGRRLRPSSAQNFPLFLREVMQRSPEAFFPPRTTRVAKGDLRAVVLLRAEELYVNYRKWVLCCMTAMRSGM